MFLVTAIGQLLRQTILISQNNVQQMVRMSNQIRFENSIIGALCIARLNNKNHQIVRLLINVTKLRLQYHQKSIN